MESWLNFATFEGRDRSPPSSPSGMTKAGGEIQRLDVK